MICKSIARWGREYTDLSRNEFIEKITADLRGSKNQAITKLFNDYVKSTEVESEMQQNPYIEVIGEVLSRAPKLTDYEVNLTVNMMRMKHYH